MPVVIIKWAINKYIITKMGHDNLSASRLEQTGFSMDPKRLYVVNMNVTPSKFIVAVTRPTNVFYNQNPPSHDAALAKAAIIHCNLTRQRRGRSLQQVTIFNLIAIRCLFMVFRHWPVSAAICSAFLSTVKYLTSPLNHLSEIRKRITYLFFLL